VLMRASSPSPSRFAISSSLSSVPGPLTTPSESNCQSSLLLLSAFLSRRSMESAVTLPTRSGTYRSRSGTRRESGRLAVPRHTVFSTATSSSSFFAFYPPSDLSSPPHIPPVGLARRRSLPSAKPAPSAVPLPSVPAAGTSPLPLPQASFPSSRGAAGRHKLHQTSPSAARGGGDTRTSFVPSEFSSGSSTNTISYGAMPPSSPGKGFSTTGNFQQSPRGDRREVARTNSPLTKAKIVDQSLGEHHSNFRGGVSPGRISRVSSPWALPRIQTSDFRLSIALPRSFTPSIPSPPSSPRLDVAQSPSPSSTSSQQQQQPSLTAAPTSASPLSPSSSSIHSLQSIQSMQSMLESTSSTSTVTLDELAETEAALDLADAFEGDRGVGPGGNTAAAANGEDDMDLGVEDGLQSFRVSFGLEALGLDATFDSSLTFATAGADEDMGAGSFPVSVHGSSGSEGSEKALPGGRLSAFSSLRSPSAVHSRQTLVGTTSTALPSVPVDTAGTISFPNQGATASPRPTPPVVSTAASPPSPSPAERVKMGVLAGAAPFPPHLADLKGPSDTSSPDSTVPGFDDRVSSTAIQRLALIPPPPTLSFNASTTAAVSDGMELKRDVPVLQVDRASTIGRASTVASTRYKKSKRSDALAQLEGRVLQSGYQFAPPHLKSSASTSAGGVESKPETKKPKASFLSTEDVGHFQEQDEVKSISVTSFLPESVAGSGSGSSSSNSTLTLSTKAGESRSIVNGSGLGYAYSEWDLSFGPSRHDKRRTRRIMMLSNTAFVRVAGDLEGPASRSSPALLLSAQQQQHQHFRSHSNSKSENTGGSSLASHSRSGSFASLDVPTPSTPSSHTTGHTSSCHDGPKRRRGPGIPLSTQSTASSDASSFACTGMAWSEGGFVSFIESDSEDYPNTPADATGAASPLPLSGVFSKMAGKEKSTASATGTKTKHKMSKREKLARIATGASTANPKQHGVAASADSFLDWR
jgi:hypothetical protein